MLLQKAKFYFLSIYTQKWDCWITWLFYFSGFFLGVSTPAAYGGSQARGQIRAIAAILCHSHNTVRSELHLPPTPQFRAMPDP